MSSKFEDVEEELGPNDDDSDGKALQIRHLLTLRYLLPKFKTKPWEPFEVRLLSGFSVRLDTCMRACFPAHVLVIPANVFAGDP